MIGMHRGARHRRRWCRLTGPTEIRPPVAAGLIQPLHRVYNYCDRRAGRLSDRVGCVDSSLRYRSTGPDSGSLTRYPRSGAVSLQPLDRQRRTVPVDRGRRAVVNQARAAGQAGRPRGRGLRATRRGPGWVGPGGALGVHARPASRRPIRNLGVRVEVVRDADRPTRADNGRVASYSMHIDIDRRIDGNWITRILRST